MNRSRRILIAIGLGTLAALAAPYVIRAVVDRQVTSGKVQVFEGTTNRDRKDLVLCLIRQPSSLNLTVASNDAFTNQANGLAVIVVETEDWTFVRAWLPKGQQLTPAQIAQLRSCAPPPPI